VLRNAFWIQVTVHQLGFSLDLHVQYVARDHILPTKQGQRVLWPTLIRRRSRNGQNPFVHVQIHLQFPLATLRLETCGHVKLVWSDLQLECAIAMRRSPELRAARWQFLVGSKPSTTLIIARASCLGNFILDLQNKTRYFRVWRVQLPDLHQ
jgi:hypothetical protein